MKAIINHFTDNDLYTFTCMYYILQKYPRAETEYCFFDRNRTCYPQGFDQLLREQLEHLEEVVITDEERAFMTRMFPFLPYWFINVFLRGYRFNSKELTITQDEEGHLDIRVKGKWWSTIMWEMPILSIISELMHQLNGGGLTAVSMLFPKTKKRSYRNSVLKLISMVITSTTYSFHIIP